MALNSGTCRINEFISKHYILYIIYHSKHDWKTTQTPPRELLCNSPFRLKASCRTRWQSGTNCKTIWRVTTLVDVSRHVSVVINWNGMCSTFLSNLHQSKFNLTETLLIHCIRSSFWMSDDCYVKDLSYLGHFILEGSVVVQDYFLIQTCFIS